MNKPIITIGMPVFNGEKYISDAIGSLLKQTETHFELIISDNCSTDKTYKICKRWERQDTRIRLYRQTHNLGPQNNFKFVLSKARNQFFVWAAHDDLWSNDWLEKLLSKHTTSTSLTFGRVINFQDDLSKELAVYQPKEFTFRKIWSKTRFMMEEDTRGKANLIYGMYKTAQLKRAFGNDVFQQFNYAEDMLFVYKLLQLGDINCDHTTTLYKRIIDYPLRTDITVLLIIRRLLLTDRIKTYLAYGQLSSTLSLSLTCYLLFPVKYFTSLSYSVYHLAKRYLRLNYK